MKVLLDRQQQDVFYHNKNNYQAGKDTVLSHLAALSHQLRPRLISPEIKCHIQSEMIVFHLYSRS